MNCHICPKCSDYVQLAAGVHPKLVQQRLGYTTIKMTMDLYSHSSPGLQDQVAQRLDTIIGTA